MSGRWTYEPSDEVIKPQFVIEKLYELTGGDGHHRHRRGAAPDVGGAVLQVRYAEENWLSSGGLGTMGYGSTGAIARRSPSDKNVFSISGDGSIQMNIQEIATSIENNIPVKVVI